MNKTGLILEGGGMRGAFTAGVLDYFLEHNITFNTVIGVSAGACHACSYISKQKGRAFAISTDYLDDHRYCSLYSLLTTGDLFGAKFVYDTIPNTLNYFDHETFNTSETSVIAVITDVVSGQANYYPLKDMNKDITALRASASLPFVSRMVEVEGHYYLDGGISDSVPLAYMIENNINKNVVVLTQPRGYRKTADFSGKLASFVYRRYPKLVEKIKDRHLRYNETMSWIEALEDQKEILVIRPQMKLNIGRTEKDKEKLRNCYYLGYNEAKSQHEALMNYLKK